MAAATNPNPQPGPTAATIALLFGFGLLIIGNGLQATLIGVRTQTDGFSAVATTIIITGYFAGYLIGTKLVTRALGQVGHIRVYAALASLASTASLIHAVQVNPGVWMAMRFLTGVCLAGIYIVVESWLNDVTTNSTRGRIMGAYMIVTMGGFALGNVIFEWGDPNGLTLFVVASVLCSLSLVPIALSTTPAPLIEIPDAMPILEMARIVPTGVIAGVLIGFMHGGFMGMISVFGSRAGLSDTGIARFAIAPMLGAVVLQFPIGLLSDRVSRRWLMLTVSFSALLISAGLTMIDPASAPALVLMFLLGGMVFPLYSLTVAYVNDWLPRSKIVGSAATFALLIGIGAVLGPLVTGALMSKFGNDYFFWTMVGANLILSVYLVWRLVFGDQLPENRKGRWVPLASRGASVLAAFSGRDHRQRPLD